MKKYLTLLLIPVLFACTTSKNENEFTVNVSVDKNIKDYVFLQKRMAGALTNIDSAYLDGGECSFTGTINFPEVYFINIPETKSLVPFFTEPAEISVTINTEQIDKSSISGSASQDKYEAYLNSLETFDREVKEAYQMYRQADEFGNMEKVEYFDSVIDATYSRKKQFIIRYLMNNGNQVITPYIAFRNAYQLELEDMIKITSSFDETVKSSVYNAYLDEYITTLKRVDIGQLFVSFSMQHTSGDYHPISKYIGDKYLLIDFWASWCGPCRRENPYLVGVYNEFKDNGFEIVGVSFDTSKDNWLQAIEDDGLVWPQLSDLKGWDNAAGRLYGVRSIPANVLIDKEGFIVARNLKSKELRELLENIFINSNV